MPSTVAGIGFASLLLARGLKFLRVVAWTFQGIQEGGFPDLPE